MTFIKAYLHPGNDQFYKRNDDAHNQIKQTSRHGEKSDNNNSHKKCLNSSPDRNLVDDYLFEIPRDPFISPLYASDEVLKQLPPLKLLVRLWASIYCLSFFFWYLEFFVLLRHDFEPFSMLK